MFKLYQNGDFVKNISAAEIQQSFFDDIDKDEKDKLVFFRLKDRPEDYEYTVEPEDIAAKIQEYAGNILFITYDICESKQNVFIHPVIEWIFKEDNKIIKIIY